ncbi:MAG: PspC domain-containing protein [Chloroflexaceae bacterium]
MQTQLTRTSNDKLVAGVCGGLARYFNIDSTIVRLVFLVAILSGVSPLVYIVLWIVMPEDTTVGARPNAMTDGTQNSTNNEWQYDPYTGQRVER